MKMTESNVKRLATTLLGAITDKDPLVQEQLCNSLCYLGESKAEETLNACDEYLRQHEKLVYPYRVIILKAMETIVKNNIDELDRCTAKIVIILASNEMTKSKELILDWQQAASSVLVAVGKRFINRVMEEVLTKFQPGILPHYFVMQTFANLSVTNVFGMVPFLNSILTTMLPMLHLARQDQMKAVFCFALQHFSDSILEYLANLDQAPDPTVRKDTFSTEIFSAYDVLFNHWLQSREGKLRLAVVQALGPMSHLMPSEKLEEQLPRLIPGIIALYKKHSETFYVSKSLGQILEASVNMGSRTLEVQVDMLLAALHPQICAPVDSFNPLVIKNHNEVLRCFTILACSFPDRLLAFLLPKLENSNERIRVGTLHIMRQVINSASVQMEIKKPFILSSMKFPLVDTNNKVKRAVVQVISAMAHHGYLEQPGGEMMIEYILRQCALPPELGSKKQISEIEDSLTSDSVRTISINTLYLISTTVDRMNDVLWPYLLEFLIPVQFTNALTPLCKSLMHLAMKRQEEGENSFLIQYDSNVNLPSPFALTTRLLIVSSNPYLGEGRGAASLRLLNVLHLNIHPLLGQRWKKTIPPLVNYLEEFNEETLSQKEWEEKLLMLALVSIMCLQFLRDTLTVVSDNTWICQLSLEMCKQLNCYNGTPLEKNFLYKCIGTTLGAASNKEIVRKHLQELLETARYQEEAEREGLACSFGICAINHLDDTLAKLEDFVKSDIFRKSVGIFNIFKDRSDTEVDKVKSTLILCYGHVAMRAPQELVLARIESDILRNVFQYFNTKDLTLKLCLIRSICMISQAICNSVQSSSFVFSQKAELVTQMMEFIRAEPMDFLKTAIRKRAMIACTYLSTLEPPLEDLDKAELIHSCLHSVLALPSDAGITSYFQETLYFDTMTALKDLLTRLLLRNLSPQGLQNMFEHLTPWIKSPKGHERERALGLSAYLLRYFLEHLNVIAIVPFYNLGLLVGIFSPRCADSLSTLRHNALDCVYSLLYIQLFYEGFAQDYQDEVAEKLLSLKDSLIDPNVSILFHTCYSIAQIIGKRLPPDQFISFLLTIFEGLKDSDANCARAATVIINCLLKERGAVLLEKVPEIMGLIHGKLCEVKDEHVVKAIQQSVYLLASQHKAAVVASLLASPLPFDSHTCSLWRALATEPTLTSQVLELLLDKMNKDVPFTENKSFLLSSSYDRVATVIPLAATCALYEIMSAPESGAAVLGLYPELFVTLLLRVSCTVGVQLPRNLQAKERKSTNPRLAPKILEPCSCAVETLQAMLSRGGSGEVITCMGLEGGWELMKTSEGHEEGVTLLARAMAKHSGPKLPLIVKTLIPVLNSVYEIQRITTIAYFAELLSSNVVNDLILLESLLDNTMSRQKDVCPNVRRLVLRGLANIATGSPDKVRKHGPQLLTAMINGLDDKDDPHNLVALDAMLGLSRLLDLAEEWDVRSILLHITIRIRPFFDNERDEFRSSSINLFGHLNKFCHGNCEDVFFEQIINGLVSLLLHLQDPKPSVVRACKFALRMCGPNMECDELTDLFERQLHDGRGLHFGEFMNDTSKYLMQSFPDTLSRIISTNLFYFKSCWEDIRAAAPMFIGFLVLHADKVTCEQVDLNQLLSALQLLLKDPAPTVRIKAAETLGRLVKFA
ncbi:maestro heat-like repeat-containing protein family member 1 isoform X2 [Monodelphis domestica]|uniref:maestro heat-like repeat-containing protein family member 1 isoform X2 n=1 Tax=Monodelphis domestica TaxID=13616 RepID=UPI0004432A16|nr:maestro heat-like repeat-containing protein family member 1 isoform X2 [Monodelphis domestica]XP_056676680.1 maestro heat-like repeat-containing protein family member 1 isoform X2 [Monodelphis domestica]